MSRLFLLALVLTISFATATPFSEEEDESGEPSDVAESLRARILCRVLVRKLIKVLQSEIPNPTTTFTGREIEEIKRDWVAPGPANRLKEIEEVKKDWIAPGVAHRLKEIEEIKRGWTEPGPAGRVEDEEDIEDELFPEIGRKLARKIRRRCIDSVKS